MANTEDVENWLFKKYGPIVLGVIVSAAAGGGTMKLWDQAQIDRIEKAQAEQGEAQKREIEMLEGIRDVCRGVIYTGQSREYYQGVDEQKVIKLQERDAGQ